MSDFRAFLAVFESYLLQGEVKRAIWLLVQTYPKYELPQVLRIMRKQGSILVAQGEWYVKHGNTILEAGRKQLEAADALEEGLEGSVVMRREAERDLAEAKEDKAEAEQVTRTYISAVKAASVALRQGPHKADQLWRKVVDMGARCASPRSLVSMLLQKPEIFMKSESTGDWRLHPNVIIPDEGEPTAGKNDKEDNLDGY